MSFVNNVYSMWEDLEVSYASKGNGEGRREFLLRLIKYDPETGGTLIDTLKAKLMEEYVGNEFKCDILTKIFDAISKNLSRILTTQPTDLNDFIGSLVANDRVEVSASAGSLTNEMFANLNPMRSAKTTKTFGLEQLFLATGSLTDIFKPDMTDYALLDAYGDDDVVVVKSNKSMSIFVERFKKGGEFINKAHAALTDYIAKKQMGNYLIIVSPNIFNKRGSKVTLYPNGARISLEIKEIVKTGHVEYARCTHTFGLVETEICCVL